MKPWFAALIAFIFAACQTPVRLPTGPTPPVTVAAAPLFGPTSTPGCRPAPGVFAEIHRKIYGNIELEVRGLAPGEQPSVFYSAQNRRVSSRIEASQFAQGADAQGMFSYELKNLEVLEGDSHTTWDIRVVHSRGVVCVEITLP